MEVVIEREDQIFRISKFLRDSRRKSSNTLLRHLLMQKDGNPVYISQKYLQVQQQLPASSISSDLQMLLELGFPLSIEKAYIEMELQESIIEPQERVTGTYKLYSLLQPFEIVIDLDSKVKLPILDLGRIPTKDNNLLGILEFLRSPQKLQIVRFLLQHPETEFNKEELYSGVIKMVPNLITNTSERLVNFSKLYDNPMFDVTYPERIPHIGIKYRGVRFNFEETPTSAVEVKKTGNIAYVAKSV